MASKRASLIHAPSFLVRVLCCRDSLTAVHYSQVSDCHSPWPRRVIHVVGPVWRQKLDGELEVRGKVLTVDGANISSSPLALHPHTAWQPAHSASPRWSSVKSLSNVLQRPDKKAWAGVPGENAVMSIESGADVLKQASFKLYRAAAGFSVAGNETSWHDVSCYNSCEALLKSDAEPSLLCGSWS